MTAHQPLTPPAPPQPPQRGPGLAIAGLVLGLCALLFSLIPIIGMIAWVLAPLGLIFGIIGLRAHKAMAITGIATSAVALVVCIAWVGSFASSVSEVAERPAPPALPVDGNAPTGTAPTGSADLARGNALADVRVASCEVDANPYFPSVKAQVEIVNSSDNLATYTATIAADAADGSRLGEGPVFASSLQPGQSTTQEAMVMLDGEPSGEVTCSVVTASALPF